MPPSADSQPPGQEIAVAAEAIYLTNLMLAPGLAFVALAWLWHRHRGSAAPLARCHLEQTFWTSLWGGAAIVTACTAFIALLGLHSEWTWTVVIMYFTCIHSTLIMFGILGLAKAMAGQPYVYPLIGRRCD